MGKLETKQAYHHGDLRSALIDTGLRLIAEKESGDIGLREVARETGVSATAVYRHFPDKHALLGALAEQGYDKLADDQEAAGARAKSIGEAFRASGRAYVYFAIANPALFRLMTSRTVSTSDCDSGSVVGENRAGQLLRDNIAALLPGDASDQTKEIAVVQAFALVHGLAQLVLAGQVPNDPEIIDAAVDQFGGWEI